MIVIVLFSVVCAVLMWKYVVRTYYDAVPSYPGGLPIVGHVIKLFKENELFNTLINDMGNFSNNNGGIIKFFFGPSPVYVISDPDDALTVLNKCLDKLFIYKLISAWVGEELVAAEVPTWKRNRRILDLAFKQNILDEYMNLFNRQASRLLERLEAEVGKEVDMTNILSSNVMETVCQTSIGLGLHEKKIASDKYLSAVEEMLKIMTVRGQSPWLYPDVVFNLTNLKRKQDEALSVVLEMTSQIVEIRKAEHLKRLRNQKESGYEEGGKFKSFLDIILEKTVNEEGSIFSDVQLRQLVDNILLAGHDTTTYQILFTLLCIGSYEHIQKKIYEEIIQMLGKDVRDVTKEDLAKLEYLEAVIKETLRLYPVGPIVGRQADKEVKLRSHNISSGSYLLVHIWAINRNRTYWADADRYRPERWLDPTSLSEHPAAFASFSPGRRNCIGKSYAMMYMKTTLVTILRKYKLTSNHNNLKLRFDVMLRPVSGHLMKLEMR